MLHSLSTLETLHWLCVYMVASSKNENFLRGNTGHETIFAVIAALVASQWLHRALTVPLASINAEHETGLFGF